MMNILKQKKAVILGLGYAGLIPFFILPLLALLYDPYFMSVYKGYVVSIAAFMAGGLWGKALHGQDVKYLYLSIMLAISAWGLLFISQPFFQIGLSILYAVLLISDLKQKYPDFYIALRQHLTAGVIASLLMTMFLNI